MRQKLISFTIKVVFVLTLLFGSADTIGLVSPADASNCSGSSAGGNC